ncbi:MAG: sucrase ferredoxin [Thermomicrobiales bacterium]
MTASSTAPETRPRLQLCSLVSEASGEDPIGSAWSTPRFVAIELPLPWPYDMLSGTNVPPGLKDFVTGLYAQGIYWGMLGIAPDPALVVEGHTRVIVFDQIPMPSTGYAVREFLFPTAQLGDLLTRFAGDEADPAIAPFQVERSATTRDLFTCTHGAIDACCAKFGYPVFRELKRLAADAETDTRVWRCTHFGGHRFAPTVLEMPSGRYWGRLTGPHLAGIVTHDLPGSAMRAAYRGWALFPHPLAQVAEGEAFRRGGWAWAECAVEATGIPEDPEAITGTITLTYRHPEGETGAITIEVIPDGTIETMGSSSSPETMDAQQYRCVVTAVSPADGILGHDPARPAAD